MLLLLVPYSQLCDESVTTWICTGYAAEDPRLRPSLPCIRLYSGRCPEWRHFDPAYDTKKGTPKHPEHPEYCGTRGALGAGCFWSNWLNQENDLGIFGRFWRILLVQPNPNFRVFEFLEHGERIFNSKLGRPRAGARQCSGSVSGRWQGYPVTVLVAKLRKNLRSFCKTT